MNQRHFENTSHLSVNVHLMVENVTRDKNGTITCVSGSVKIKWYVEPKITVLCILNLSLCEQVLYQYKDEQNSLREIFFKNCTHYFLHGMINIKKS